MTAIIDDTESVRVARGQIWLAERKCYSRIGLSSRECWCRGIGPNGSTPPCPQADPLPSPPPDPLAGIRAAVKERYGEPFWRAPR